MVLDSNNREHTFHGTQIKPYPTLSSLEALASDPQVLLVKVCKKKEDPCFKETEKNEYYGILAKGGVKAALRSSLAADANFVGNRFVNVIKDFGSQFEQLKSRWMLLGYSDREKEFTVNEAPVLLRFSHRILFFLAVSHIDCVLWTRDAEQAYLQSKPLPRSVYNDPPKESNVDPQKFSLEEILPQYGLADSITC